MSNFSLIENLTGLDVFCRNNAEVVHLVKVYTAIDLLNKATCQVKMIFLDKQGNKMDQITGNIPADMMAFNVSVRNTLEKHLGRNRVEVYMDCRLSYFSELKEACNQHKELTHHVEVSIEAEKNNFIKAEVQLLDSRHNFLEFKSGLIAANHKDVHNSLTETLMAYFSPAGVKVNGEAMFSHAEVRQAIEQAVTGTFSAQAVA